MTHTHVTVAYVEAEAAAWWGYFHGWKILKVTAMTSTTFGHWSSVNCPIGVQDSLVNTANTHSACYSTPRTNPMQVQWSLMESNGKQWKAIEGSWMHWIALESSAAQCIQLPLGRRTMTDEYYQSIKLISGPAFRQAPLAVLSSSTERVYV